MAVNEGSAPGGSSGGGGNGQGQGGGSGGGGAAAGGSVVPTVVPAGEGAAQVGSLTNGIIPKIQNIVVGSRCPLFHLQSSLHSFLPPSLPPFLPLPSHFVMLASTCVLSLAVHLLLAPASCCNYLPPSAFEYYYTIIIFPITIVPSSFLSLTACFSLALRMHRRASCNNSRRSLFCCYFKQNRNPSPLPSL